MTLQEINRNLKRMLNSPERNTLKADEFSAVFCATQELDQYERLLKRAQWHDVIKDPPNPNQHPEVLVAWNNGKIEDFITKHVLYVADPASNLFITHWMVMPELPEIQGKVLSTAKK